MTVPVLILAGSRDGERDPLAQMGKVTHKALLPIGGTPMIDRVVHSLEQTSGIGRIWVSIEHPEYLAHLGDRAALIKASPSPSESVLNAVRMIGTPCLVTTADHALLQPQWVEEFLEKSCAAQVDLTAGIALRETIQRDVPQTERTYIHLSDISFSGCNLFWLGNETSLEVIALWRQLQRYRKRPWRMALTLGLSTILRVLTKTLTSQRLEERIHTLTGASVRLIPLSDGRAAVDVDKPSDAHLVAQLLETW